MSLQSSQKHPFLVSPENLFCLLESVFSCSFSNATFSSDGSQGIYLIAREMVADGCNCCQRIPFMTLNLHLCEAGNSYLNAKHK